MSIIYVIIILAVIGFLVYAIEANVPMSSFWKTAIRVVAIIGTIVWLLKLGGIKF